MKTSAGLAITYQNKLLLVHPTNAPWRKMFGIPKGGVDDGESHLEAAIRETKEEIGFSVDKSKLKEKDEIEIFYVNKKGKHSKRLVFWEYPLDEAELPSMGIDSDKLVIPKNKLQLDEVDWAGFIDKSTMSSKILPNQYQIIKYLKTFR